MDSTARKISAVPPPQPAEVPDEAARELFYYMVLARAMEERALNLYRQGKLPGSYYTGRGQEAISVGMALPLRHGPIVRALDWRPLALIGVASYSLYLWHLPIVTALAPNALVWALPLSLLVAFVSYRVVEEPFLRVRRRWSSSSYRST